jgi:putative GTP pyrophosphokinase
LVDHVASISREGTEFSRQWLIRIDRLELIAIVGQELRNQLGIDRIVFSTAMCESLAVVGQRVGIDGVVAVLVYFLTQRLIVSESDRRASLDREAAKHGLRINSDFAVRIGIQQSDLREIKEWLQRCERAISNVRQLVGYVLSKQMGQIPLLQLTRIESRVKTLDSIFQKFAKSKANNWAGLTAMEDVAGVRLICPTNSSIDQLQDLCLQYASTFGISLSRSFETAKRDYRAEPTTTGYKALHLILDVETQFDGQSKMVPCELQMRTMLADVWATIAHSTAYGVGKNQRKKFAKDLKEMADSLQKCELLVEDIASVDNLK